MNEHVKADTVRDTHALLAPSAPVTRLPRGPFVVAALLAAGAIGWGINLHWRRDAQAAATQRDTRDFEPTLRVATALRGVGVVKLTLPGTTVAFEQARLSARATGFVAERRADIGTRVHAGDLLAKIAAPDLDQQLEQAVATLGQRTAALGQARANVVQARSTRELAGVTDGRISKLAKDGWATQQNADQTRLGLAAQEATLSSAEADVGVAEANFRAQEATVRQLRELTGFERIVAPFDGIVTERNVDVGDLVSGSATGGTALFVLQRDDVLRVRVDVPQSAAAGLTDGIPATVTMPERPNEPQRGIVARNASALSVASRTLPIEVDVANGAHLLSPGLFVSVAISIPQPSPTVTVPAGAILFNGQGLRVAIVDDAGNVAMRDVSIYRDDGTSVELLTGLVGGERVAIGPPADLRDGSKVRAPTPGGEPTAVAPPATSVAGKG